MNYYHNKKLIGINDFIGEKNIYFKKISFIYLAPVKEGPMFQ